MEHNHKPTSYLFQIDWTGKSDEQLRTIAAEMHRRPEYMDHYKVLELDYDATDENIRLNYRKLALKWHPDKHKDDEAATSKFQEINEAYKVLSDPTKRLEYDLSGNYEIDKYTLGEYLARFKGMILTCNGLGISQPPIWSKQLMEARDLRDK